MSSTQVTLKIVFLDGSISNVFGCMYALANANPPLYTLSRIFGTSFGGVTVDVNDMRIEYISNPGKLA